MKNIGYIKQKTSSRFKADSNFPFDKEFEQMTGFPVFEGYTLIDIRDGRLTVNGWSDKVINSDEMLDELVLKKYDTKDKEIKAFMVLKKQGTRYMVHCYPTLEDLKKNHKNFCPFGFQGIFNNLKRDDVDET